MLHGCVAGFPIKYTYSIAKGYVINGGTRYRSWNLTRSFFNEHGHIDDDVTQSPQEHLKMFARQSRAKGLQ